MRLNKEKTAVVVNEALTLENIPAEALEYKLGNRRPGIYRAADPARGDGQCQNGTDCGGAAGAGVGARFITPSLFPTVGCNAPPFSRGKFDANYFQGHFMNPLASQFQNPSAAFRGKPFWSWNGELTQDELIRQIHVMQEMGLGGFFMHSRTGLVTEYLGDEWFALTNACAEEAEKLGMEAWLYDEDRWPSGTAGGMVTENPAYRIQFMSLRPVNGKEFVWSDDLVAAFACQLDGLAYTNCRRIDAQTPVGEYESDTVLAFTLEEMAQSSFYNGYTYVDTMNKEATEHYIHLTHEKYKERCGDHFGKSIQGIFTDEPHRGPAMTGFGLSNENRLWMTPWTERLPEEFEAQFGTDLIEHLPELFLQPNGEAVSPIKWQYMELTQQLFLQNFAKPLYDWCGDNKLRLTGHVLHEDNLTSQAAMQGSLMRFYEYLHDPGVDILTEDNRNYVVVKQLASAARQLGQKWLLSELYGCTGWQMNFQSHKEIGDWQALLGINLRCHHLSWYTMEGEAKRDYPASILHQSAWWKDYDYVESYFARLGLLLTQGEPCRDILVINPVESVWCQIHSGWADGLSPTQTPVLELERDYADLAAWLLGAQLDYDYGDEEMLGRLSSVGEDADGKPIFQVGQASYRVIVVGHMTTMRATTLRLLDAFAQAGGTVIFAGEPPAYADALPSPAPAELAARTVALPWDAAPLIAHCRRAITNDVQIVDAVTGETLSDIFCQLRSDGETRYLVAININPNAAYDQVLIRIPTMGFAEEWDCRSGARYAVSAPIRNGCRQITTSFPPSGERAYVLAPIRNNSLPAKRTRPETGRVTCSGPFAYTLGEENVCVLDFARFQLDDGAWSGRREILKVDSAVRTALNLPWRGGEMVQPWFHRKYHPAPPVHARLTLSFEFDIQDLPESLVHLCLERPEQWRLALNGQSIAASAEGWWVDTAFQKIALPSEVLKLGANTLTLETDFHDWVNLEAIYLIGAFGVTLHGNRPALTRLPETIAVGDLTTQGFPFYGGPLTYQLPVALPAKAGPKLLLQTPHFEAACLQALSRTHPPAVIAFAPYQAEVPAESVQNGLLALEVVLTRRNTFGPLHQIPLRDRAYGPGNFTTDGADFSEEYQLYPAGLLEAPEVAY